jgi:hypothetical protein
MAAAPANPALAVNMARRDIAPSVSRVKVAARRMAIPPGLRSGLLQLYAEAVRDAIAYESAAAIGSLMTNSL